MFKGAFSECDTHYVYLSPHKLSLGFPALYLAMHFKYLIYHSVDSSCKFAGTEGVINFLSSSFAFDDFHGLKKS